MKKSKLPKKQWKTPAEQELFDHLPAKLEYNFEGLGEENQQENFKDRYMQALAEYFIRHPVDGYFKNETYGMMFSRDEDYEKGLGQALTSVVEPYVEGKKPICAFPDYRINYLTRTIEEDGEDGGAHTREVYFSADSIPMGEKAQQAAQKIKRSYEQTRYKTDDWGTKRLSAVMGTGCFGVLTAILVPTGVTIFTKGMDGLWFMEALPDFIKLLAGIPVLLLGTVGALVSAGLLLHNLWLLFYRFTTDPKALQAEFCRVFEENATTYYRWLAFFHYWQKKTPRTYSGSQKDFDQWKKYYDDLYEEARETENKASIKRYQKKKAWPTEGLEGFVTRCYRVALGRDPDIEGFEHYVSWLREGLNDAKSCAIDFMIVDEMKRKAPSNDAFVRKLYLLFMDRAGTPDEVKAKVRELAQGRSRDELLDSFAESEEFARIAARYGIS